MAKRPDLGKALLNLDRALAALERFLRAREANEVVRAAVIQAFEFTFEAFWKVFAKVATAQGDRAPSPKLAVSRAFHYGLLAEEAVWLDMLDDRNLTVHTYNEALAEAIFTRIRDRYAPAFRQARQQLGDGELT